MLIECRFGIRSKMYVLLFCITANRRTFYDFKTDNIPGVPDGMTIDELGNLWIANYGGAQVLEPALCRGFFVVVLITRKFLR